MGRLFIYLAVIATVIGFIVLMPTGDFNPMLNPMGAAMSPSAQALVPQLMPVAVGWAAGLAMGYALAWITRIDWATFPERFGAWMQLMRHRIWWMAFGGICAGVLLFF